MDSKKGRRSADMVLDRTAEQGNKRGATLGVSRVAYDPKKRHRFDLENYITWSASTLYLPEHYDRRKQLLAPAGSS